MFVHVCICICICVHVMNAKKHWTKNRILFFFVLFESNRIVLLLIHSHIDGVVCQNETNRNVQNGNLQMRHTNWLKWICAATYSVSAMAFLLIHEIGNATTVKHYSPRFYRAVTKRYQFYEFYCTQNGSDCVYVRVCVQTIISIFFVQYYFKSIHVRSRSHFELTIFDKFFFLFCWQ